ncbi:polyribonucleotide nucleotidyltransferase [bacterium]|nr:polyribonucleotide nucleotidyltransferase [bacterium]
MIFKKEMEIGGKVLSIETGRVAKQADGAVIVRYADTMVLATVVSSKEPKEGADFFPLSVDYRESAFAAGKIPGGFFKREGRPSEKEILSSRLIDRPIRPLFPEGYIFDTIVNVQVISSDQENNADVLGGIGASAALAVSDIPFFGPIASVRVGRINGQFVINPTFKELETSDMDIVVSGTKDSIAMVEGESQEISEDDMLNAIQHAHSVIKNIVALQEQLAAAVNKPKRTFEVPALDKELMNKIVAIAKPVVASADRIIDKAERNGKLKELKNSLIEQFKETNPEVEAFIPKIIDDLQYADMRRMILEEKRRLDERRTIDIRPISCDIMLLPRVHGSALFTRGQTQALVSATLGTKIDEQFIDGVDGETSKRFMLHYNFPGYSVGEAKMSRGPGRREIGHGNLAERALKAVLPSEADFPYTIRVVSDILESNGSSSMASVCGGSLSLMDAGVPVRSSVAGIAMGLIKEDNSYAILSDILGDEDHLGDMDFKVAGTRKGITACQMDIKIKGISAEIMREALQQAKDGRMHILGIMEQTIAQAKPDISPYAPKITTLKIKVDQIGLVIGPGGKTIRDIVEKSGAKIDIAEDGTVLIASVNSEGSEIAVRLIQGLTADAEIGKTYKGIVKKITDFGAFLEILPGKEGLLHISEIDHKRVQRVDEYMKLGDEVEVLLQEIINKDGKTKYELSRKALIKREGHDDHAHHHDKEHAKK